MTANNSGTPINASNCTRRNSPTETQTRSVEGTVACARSLFGSAGQLEWRQCALQQAAAGAASLGSDRIDQRALVLDWRVEQRRHASDGARGMRIRARHFGQSKLARDLQREHVLVLAARAV